MIYLRWMCKFDLPQVMKIERASFEQPGTEADFHTALAQGIVGTVAERDNVVLGYVLYDIGERRVDVLNLAVHPDCRRDGIGTDLICLLKSRVQLNRRSRLVCHVRESNLPAQLFFRANGFRATKVLRYFYDDDDGDEDAYRFAWRLKSAANVEEGVSVTEGT